MPKAEKGTPKDIANRMKAKGLQKLKFYCQMCSKQCRGKEVRSVSSIMCRRPNIILSREFIMRYYISIYENRFSVASSPFDDSLETTPPPPLIVSDNTR